MSTLTVAVATTEEAYNAQDKVKNKNSFASYYKDLKWLKFNYWHPVRSIVKWFCLFTVFGGLATFISYLSGCSTVTAWTIGGCVLSIPIIVLAVLFVFYPIDRRKKHNRDLQTIENLRACGGIVDVKKSTVSIWEEECKAQKISTWRAPFYEYPDMVKKIIKLENLIDDQDTSEEQKNRLIHRIRKLMKAQLEDLSKKLEDECEAKRLKQDAKINRVLDSL